MNTWSDASFLFLTSTSCSSKRGQHAAASATARGRRTKFYRILLKTSYRECKLYGRLSKVILRVFWLNASLGWEASNEDNALWHSNSERTCMQVSLCEFHMKSDIASGQSVGHFFSCANNKKEGRHRISAFTAEAEFYLKRLSFLLNQPFVPARIGLSGWRRKWEWQKATNLMNLMGCWFEHVDKLEKADRSRGKCWSSTLINPVELTRISAFTFERVHAMWMPFNSDPCKHIPRKENSEARKSSNGFFIMGNSGASDALSFLGGCRNH